jgi:serine/threonine protein kinase
LAPEQLEGQAEAITPATDVYALGAMLYELLTGRPPAPADPARDTLEQVRLSQPEPPRHWRPELPQDLEAICLKCLEKEPARRYPSAAALAEDLRRFRGGEVLFIDDLDDWAQQKRWARRAGYEILELLGHNPDSFSYRARQVALDRTVFLKRITARDRFVPAAKLRFRREAYLLAGLNHPNFVQLYDHGEQNDLSYYAREFVDGRSLAEIVTGVPPDLSTSALPHRGGDRVRVAAELVEGLARAVQAAHAKGMVHGGLNPDSVRLTPAGVPKITGFQRLRLPRGDDDPARPESESSRLVAYLAPELLERRKRALPASDLYALGAILYVLLTGQPPFPGPSLRETLEQVRSQAPAPPRHGQPAIPPELEALCLKCLEKQPGRRHVGAQALADELRRLLARDL